MCGPYLRAVQRSQALDANAAAQAYYITLRDVLLGHAVRAVAGVIVVYQHLCQLQLRGVGNAIEDAGQRALCVVGNYQHTDLHGCTPFGGQGYCGATVTTAMRTQPFTANDRRALRLLVGLGAAIRIVYVLTKWNRPLGLNDSLYYSGQAYQLAHGSLFRELFVNQPGAEHGPLTSLLMAPVSFGDDYVRWQRLVTLACGIALVWLLGKLGARLGGSKVGICAAGIAAVAPNLWMNDG